MNVVRYNQYKFLQENFPPQLLNESSEFVDMQMGMNPNPLGPGFGFAQDPTMSIYSDGSSPYVDNYARVGQMANDLARVMKNLMGDIRADIRQHKLDYFLEDIEEFKNLKILRIFKNHELTIDVFISFELHDEEFFGVFRKFNGVSEPKLKTDLFTDQRFRYIDTEYYLKLTSYLYKILYNWFIPNVGEYKVIQDFNIKDSMGTKKTLKKGHVFRLKGYNEENGKLYLIIKHKEDIYTINDNDFYFFKYWTELIGK